MDNTKQRTIARPISISGIGLHTGVNTTMTFRPAPENTGYVFRRTDIKNAPQIKADIDHVVDISRGTTLEQNGVRIYTTEHVLAAVSGLEIDNILIELDNKEPPVADGSAMPFVEKLLEAGIVEQEAERVYLTVERTITYTDPEKGVDIHVLPSNQFRATFMIDYKLQSLGTQYTSFYSLEEDFVEQFAPARTFCFLHEVDELKQQGLIKGGSVDNALVMIDRPIETEELDRLKNLFGIKDDIVQGENGILNGKSLRFPNEPVRHKILDLIGDLALLGMPIQGHVIAARSGHASNVALVRLLKKEFEKQILSKRYQRRPRNRQIFLDTEAIKHILPHRYPFLLIDRIIDLVPMEKIIAVKNVTLNEPFFQGHFPGKPVMPGVLTLESMAQAGGVMLLNAIDDHDGKLVYFSAADNVRWRKLIEPGDQIIFEVDMVKYRLGTAKIHGRAFVDGELVMEADLMAAVVDK
ncbi:MAG: bifunctional UDP-3-O-[3-hydroxymyristoyl] N-acetylglucosamine deacetylase/3-hydroxyacyl-ACP dehydratase [Candidatus Marinimicrobia bacterium]|nr:bifunctional UDP-3-O-[3-hydroxymyristoyl] N-acetylglucosamine deacetylase/3-hydroxyacyl-ACP dehydratase [Candidatus Neomarinimicrobiota bacterium]MCF7839270.1 bifunctional UDP-3-O-[3-hydroxymyristoyl] N-acetylglucosamine deacetylase/3-hydroxyacyl-ACP dehydratase [Candidatus Neomarinimicrobiota bacterium]MCF7902859.1 bifunctional UDP-3-O-[3-hydroxymyristoyl] N-acetylglucosamine deacetylase/3-hydroxyacyl-ACP dehydratase [Candidatus Neomarinimicrobiota bacterium]